MSQYDQVVERQKRMLAAEDGQEVLEEYMHTL